MTLTTEPPLQFPSCPSLSCLCPVFRQSNKRHKLFPLEICSPYGERNNEREREGETETETRLTEGRDEIYLSVEKHLQSNPLTYLTSGFQLVKYDILT